MDFELAAGDFQERCPIVRAMPGGEKVGVKTLRNNVNNSYGTWPSGDNDFLFQNG